MTRAGINKKPEDFFLSSDQEFSSHLYEQKDNPDSGILFYGFDLIYNLCMGDVSTIISLCRGLFSTFTVNPVNDNGSGNIPSTLQDDVIRSFSLQKKDLVKEAERLGFKLNEIIEQFGRLSRKKVYSESNSNQNQYCEILTIIIKMFIAFNTTMKISLKHY